jgi:hypothetical protein
MIISRRGATAPHAMQRTQRGSMPEPSQRDPARTPPRDPDPLPQTIYRVRVKQGGCALVPIPLRIAP